MASRLRTRGGPPWVAVPLIGVAVLLAGPWIGMDLYSMRQVELIAILALLVASLNLVQGYTGEFSVAQVALYAAGAYLAGYWAVHYSSDILLAILLGALIAPVIGGIGGIPGLRLGGWAFGMVTFFLVLLVPDILKLDWLAEGTGGALGLLGMQFPTFFGEPLSPEGFYVVVVVTTALWYAIFRNLVVSRHGSALLVLKESPVLAASLGIPVYRLKLLAYVVSAVPAGVAGALFAHLDHYLAPESFTFNFAVLILAASVLGGSTSVYGGIAGAVLLQLGPETLSVFEGWQPVIYGGFLLVGGVLLRQGLAGLARRVASRLQPGRSAAPPSGEDIAVETSAEVGFSLVEGEPLAVRNISKRFGGVQVLEDVSFTAEPGSVTALIGPNGSGKTTMLNIVSGFVVPDSGEVTVDAHPITGSKPHVVSGHGVARTFQTPIIPKHLTTRQVVAASMYRRRRTSMASSVLRLPSHFRAERTDRSRARKALELVGIAHLGGSTANSLPLGTRRLVELARALSAQPRVILLDEVASGLDEHELQDLAGVIRRLRDSGCTIVLVEHNFALVLELADVIHVLARGTLIASGTPQEIATNPMVLTEYLGTTDAASQVRTAGHPEEAS